MGIAQETGDRNLFYGQGLGFHLGAVYAAWALGLALLFPFCRWYEGVKRRRAGSALWSYL